MGVEAPRRRVLDVADAGMVHIRAICPAWAWGSGGVSW